MEQTDSQRIGASGEKLLPTLLPPEWIVQRLDPDFGEDFRVRLVQGNAVLAHTFTVQVKTVERAKRRGNEVKLQLEQKDLVFWSDPNYRDTLFLVVIDLHTRKGYWLFLRQYLTDVGKGWKGKVRPTVYIPLANDLSDAAAFRAAVTAANEYTARATSVPAVQQIEEHFAELRRLDPRFDFKYHQHNGQARYDIQPKEAVGLRFVIQSKTKKQREAKAAKLFRRGERVRFKPGEFRIEGSPLFEWITRRGAIVQVGADVPVAMSIALHNGSERLSELQSLPGRLTGGSERLVFATTLADAPLGLRVTHDAATCRGDFNLALTPSVWTNRRLSQARMFRTVVPFVCDLPTATHATLTYHVQGESLPMGRIDLPRFAGGLHERLAVLHRVLRVATHWGVDPVLPLDDWPDTREVDVLYDILTRHAHTRRVDEGMKLSTTTDASDLAAVLNQLKAVENDIMVTGTTTFDVLGEPVTLPEVATRVDRV